MFFSFTVRSNRVKSLRFLFKLTAGLLVFLFLISPLSGVLAEEVSPAPTSEQGSSSEPAPEQVTEEPSPEEPSLSEGDASSESLQEPELPKEPDKIRRKSALEPNNSTGALTYEYPIVISPGRNNLQPDLKLLYNSQASSIDSIVSQGWSIPIPSIERINRTGAENLFSGDYFSSSLSDELVSLGDGNYAAKVDNGEFVSYSFNNNIWVALDKQGTKYTFGSTTASRQDDVNDNSKIYKWLLNEIRDVNDNYIKYEYVKDAGQIYPSSIKYTGYGAIDGISEIQFIWQARNDVARSTQMGFSVTTNSRLQEIQVKINGSWVKKYELSYDLSDNGSRSVLSSVVESGRDENNSIISLPPEQFDYQTKTKIWEKDNNWTIPLFFEYNGDQGVRMLDVNGDGLVDMVQALKETGGGSIRKVYINNGVDNWVLDENWSIPLDFVAGVVDRGVRFDDVNGDGLVDLIQNSQGFQGNGVYLNNGNNTGWTLDSSWAIPVFFTDNENPDAGVRLADANGDGLVDFIQSLKEYSSIIKRVYINNGSGWDQNINWNIPVEFSNYGTDSGVRLVDINGDGNVDLIKSNSYSPSINGVYINNGNGTGWSLDQTWSIPEFFYDNYGDMGVRLADANGDGLIDMLKSYKEQNGSTIRRVYINNGLNSWVRDDGWGLDSNCTLNVDFSVNGSYNKGVDLGDVNGDGLVDVIQSNQFGNKKDVFVALGEKADLISSITSAQGAQTDIQYKGSAEYKDANNNLFNPKLLFILQTVANISVNDGFNNIDSKNYSYSNGKYYFNNYLDRKFSGFGKVTAVDSDGNQTITSFHGGAQNEPELGEYQDHISKQGKPYRVEVKDSAGNLFSRVINKWERNDLGNNRSFVKLTRSVQSIYDGNSSHKDSAETYDYNNANGNKIETIQWGEVSASNNGDFTDLGTDKFVSEITYATGSSNNVVALASIESIYDQASTKIKESRYYYDNLALGSVGLGNQTKQEEARGGFYYINKQKVYNQYGLVVTEIDPLNHQTNYTYDTYNLYPTIVTNPLNQVSSFSYDYSSGQVINSVDVNGKVFTTYYDGLDRPITELQPDQAVNNLSVVKTVYEYVDTPNATRAKKSNYLDATNIVDTYTYFDGLGRKIQERSEAETANQYSVRDFVYRAGDLLWKESLPYFSNGSARTSATNTSTLYTVYNYDAAKRVISAQSAVGTTTNTYDDWKTSVTDAKGKVKDLYRDAYNNLVQVDEHNGAATYSTYYQWNVLKKITKITDALGNVRNFIYDSLGRVLAAEDLHAVNDSTFGVWYYSYDDASNLISKTAPNTKETVYTYDNLNRVLTEDAVGTDIVEVTYAYDNCLNGNGRLCLVANSSIRTLMEYNPLGQLTKEDKRIGRGIYETNYNYDRQGNQTIIINPDDSRVAYIYNNAGLVESVKRKESYDPELADVLVDIDYNPVALPTVMSYGNGVVTTNTYDENELYRLRHKVTVADNNNIQDLTYTYDQVGNITQIVDASNTQTAKTTSYTYDDLHRLLSATISNSAAQGVDGVDDQNQVQTLTYDAIGNILSKSDVGNYSYDGNSGSSYANPHAVTTAGYYNYAYDENGNLIEISSTQSDNSKSFVWDYASRLSSVIVDGVVSSYAYDASGQRVKEITASGTKLYPTKNYSTGSGGAEKHIFLGDTAIASVNGTGDSATVYNIHADHLTGSNVITDYSQQVDELTDYYSFGTIRIDQQNSAHNEKRKFTGHEYDADTGLTYAGTRYYDATLGRWLSQDNVFISLADQNAVEQISKGVYNLHLSDPQGLNGYSYVKNNPLKYKDVTGEYWETFIDIIFMGISAYDFNRKPNFVNGLFLGLDVAGVALPIPAVAGYIKNAARVERVASYFAKVARNGDDAFRLGRLFVDNILFNFSKRAWSTGEAGNDVASLVGHFYKHGDEVGANTVGRYYSKANDFIDSGKGVKLPTYGDRVEIWDTATNTLAVTNKEGNQIRTYYKVTNQGDIAAYNRRLNDIKK